MIQQHVLSFEITEHAVLSYLSFNSCLRGKIPGWKSLGDGSELCQEGKQRIMRINTLEAARTKGKEAGERIKILWILKGRISVWYPWNA